MAKFPFLIFLCFTLTISFSFAADTISGNQSLTGDQTLISSGENFKLGFFKPGNSSKYYIGMWYNKIPLQTIVWVANRETPITDKSSSELKIVDGNLVLLNESKSPIWSTNINSSSSISRVAVLRDDGNLVLIDSNSTPPIWQSFDNPVHTWLAGSKMGYNKRTGSKQFLTSWKSSEDPATGLFSFESDPIGNGYVLKWNGSQEYWTSGPWDGKIFPNVPEMMLNNIYNYSYINNENESYLTYWLYNPLDISMCVIDVLGRIKLSTWPRGSNQWNLFGFQPRQQCEVYTFYCGAYGTCNQNSLPFCNCVDGFRPRNQNDWDLRDYSGGCVRNMDLQCGSNSSERNHFLTNSQMGLPDHPQSMGVRSIKECEEACLGNCSCTAYAYDYDANDYKGCELWFGELINLKLLSDGNGKIIHIRLSSSEFSSGKISKGVVIGSTVGSVFGVAILLGLVWVVMRRRRTRLVGNNMKVVEGSLKRRQGIKGNTLIGLHARQFSEEDKKKIDVPFFDLESILVATDSFSEVNKLGQGGFGPVYKGVFPGGLEIAVKRLSVHSIQGLEELKNEVVLIAKLQHRNLVRLLGYCIEGDENILLYEYVPNKSLDLFIFDQIMCVLLDWAKRFEIILGIARGLLYLHQDSRLRVIHRDLKVSNILLDEDMIPKISDFGLARIVGGRETEANTNRVVGTYGYISPEYALEGLFSIKSDVFSFGVVVLEIISGKKNTGFYNAQHDLNLLGYAWRLWKEGNPLGIMDQTIVECCDKNEILKCIIIGLLCVQEDPGDRPDMSNIVVMFGSSEIENIPSPKRPAFVARTNKQILGNNELILSHQQILSNNELTLSLVKPR